MFRNAKDLTYRQVAEEDVDGDLELLDCDFCSQGGWTSETEVEIHKSMEHVDVIYEVTMKNKNYCRVCVKDCQDSQQLLKHIKTEHLLSTDEALRVQREIFICDHCSQIFYNKILFTIHIVNVHLKNKSNLKVIQCPRCTKHIRIKSVWFHFQGHCLQSVSCCPICLAKCKNKKHLRAHVKKHTKYLKCEMCLYETKREDLFEKHVMSRHKGTTRPIEINVDKYFVPVSELSWRHIKFSGLKGLQLTNGVRVCIMCREICSNENEMVNHIVVDHSKTDEVVKPEHACSCGQIFTNKVLLKHHLFKLKGDHKMIE